MYLSHEKRFGFHVALKETGVMPNDGTGGQLSYLGRILTRQKGGDSSILMSLPFTYLDSTFAVYGLTSSNSSKAGPPDVAACVEKTDGKVLSDEAYSRFRAALGKVAWMSQTRQDLRAYVSVLATKQSKPDSNVESGMRNLLRFLKTDMHVVVRMPAEGSVLDRFESFGSTPHLVCFSDASHAPLRVTQRRGISGGVLSFGGSLVKTLSRHQQMVSLSSMEAELFALQHVAQEMCGLGRVVGRILRSFGETKLAEIPGVLYTDSESALKLLKNMDVPRKSRHLEIRLEWLKQRVNEGKLVLSFRKGVQNPSDLLTKCLSSAVFNIHRESLGFETLDGPLFACVDADPYTELLR